MKNRQTNEIAVFMLLYKIYINKQDKDRTWQKERNNNDDITLNGRNKWQHKHDENR